MQLLQRQLAAHSKGPKIYFDHEDSDIGSGKTDHNPKLLRKYTQDDINQSNDSLAEDAGANDMAAIGEQIMTETNLGSDDAENVFNRNLNQFKENDGGINNQVSFGKNDDPFGFRPRRSTRKGRFFNRNNNK